MEHLNLYHEFAEKLDASKKSVEVDESLRFAYEEQVNITAELRSSDDTKAAYALTLKILFILAAAVFVAHVIIKGLWLGVAGLTIASFLYVINKVVLTRASKNVLRSFSEPQPGKLLMPTDLLLIRKYNVAILELKLARVRLIQVISVILTPLVFFCLYEMIWGRLTLLIAGLAILLGSFVWMIYFHGNIDLLKKKVEAIKA